MEKDTVLERIENEKLIAIVRMSGEWETIKATLDALALGGVTLIEITTSVPGAVGIVKYLSSIHGRRFLVGAGTVLDEHAAVSMMDAGAEFIVSPAVIEGVIAASNRTGVPVFPGALSPTEVWRAHDLGADAVKVFPASLFGPSYLKALAGPLAGIRLIPTGGIDLMNIASYVEAGSFAVGVGGGLIDMNAVRSGDWEAVRSGAAAYVAAVREATR